MEFQHYISHYCVLDKSRVVVDGQRVLDSIDEEFATFAKSAYKTLNIQYPKFYKMDSLSKLGFIAAEFLLKEIDDKEGISLVLMNKSGSLDTDVKHQESIQDPLNYYPSPAVFVYTLANICVGEISIRHGLQTENVFLVDHTFNSLTVKNYADYLIASGKASKVICGWLELFSNNYKAVLYLVEQNGVQSHNLEEIEKLFLK